MSFLQAPLTKAGERRKRRRALESQYDNQEQLAMLRRAEGDVRAMRRQIRQGAEAAGLPIPPEAAKLPAGKGRGQHTQWWSGKGGYNYKGWKGYGTSDYCKGGYGTDDCGYKGGYGGYKGNDFAEETGWKGSNTQCGPQVPPQPTPQPPVHPPAHLQSCMFPLAVPPPPPPAQRAPSQPPTVSPQSAQFEQLAPSPSLQPCSGTWSWTQEPVCQRTVPKPQPPPFPPPMPLLMKAQLAPEMQPPPGPPPPQEPKPVQRPPNEQQQSQTSINVTLQMPAGWSMMPIPVEACARKPVPSKAPEPLPKKLPKPLPPWRQPKLDPPAPAPLPAAPPRRGSVATVPF